VPGFPASSAEGKDRITFKVITNVPNAMETDVQAMASLVPVAEGKDPDE